MYQNKKMKQEKVSLSKIKPNKANPRVIKDSKFHKLVNSILVFPKMMEARPIVVNSEFVVLGGNMRLKALETIKTMQEAEIRSRLNNMTDFTLKPQNEQEALVSEWINWQDCPETYVVNAKEFTDAEQKQFIVKDNASFGEWDFGALSMDFDIESLGDWGVDITAPFDPMGLNKPMPTEGQFPPQIGASTTPECTNNGEVPQASDLELPSVPVELQENDLRAIQLPKLEGEDETPKNRVIIVFERSESGKVAQLLGLEEINQVVYVYSQLPCAEL